MHGQRRFSKVMSKDDSDHIHNASRWGFTMRRWFAALSLCISILCPAALPVSAQHGTVNQDKQTQTVYITRTGKKYHRDGCQHLAASKIAISLKDAKAKGYTACKACHPPE